jgi:SAM-dependent methyltransferase
MEESWFEKWFNTPYYHLLYSNRNDEEAFSFIRKIIDILQPKQDATILDVACGKGRHAIQLSEMGFDVTGIDLSAESIASAKKSETDHLLFFIHDMRNPFRINYFDIAFNFFTSFGYFDSKSENMRAMRSITEGIKKNGVLILDYLNSDFTLSTLVAKEVRSIEGIVFEISRTFDAYFFYKTITIKDPSIEKTLTFTEKVSRLSLSDFKSMMNHCSLEIEQVWGDYELNPFDVQQSPRMIIMARKTSN